MVLFGTIDSSRKLILSPVTNELRNGFIASCKPGEIVKVTMTRCRPDKTRKQLGTIWGLLIPIAKQAMDDAGIDCMGVPLTKDMVKNVLYRYCGGVGENGEIVSMSDMNIEQASLFFENCRMWLSKNFHVDVPDPDPNWRMAEAMET
jgi:hypothetical protein